MLQRFLEKARAPRLCGLETAGFLWKMAIEEIDSCAVAAIDSCAVAAIRSYANYMPLESTTSNCTMLDQFSAFCTIFWSKLVQKAERQVGASA